MARNNNGRSQQGDKNSRGKGWFGDSAGHAEAGRKGGKARSKNRSNQMNNNG